MQQFSSLLCSNAMRGDVLCARKEVYVVIVCADHDRFSLVSLSLSGNDLNAQLTCVSPYHSYMYIYIKLYKF